MSDYDDEVLATPGLIAYYPLDETSGATAFDLSGNGHHGTWDNALKGRSSTIPVEIGATTAGEFDDDIVRRIVLPNSVVINPGDDFTFISWARVPIEAYVGLGESNTTNRPLFNIGVLDSPNRCTAHLPNIAADAMGSASFDYGSIGTGRTYGPDLRDQNLIDANVFVAAVADIAEQTRRIYVNGDVAGAATATAGPSVQLVGGHIGWWTNVSRPERFVGVQAGVAFFRRALTFTEVRDLYCAGDPSGCGGGWQIGKVGISAGSGLP